MSRLIIPSLACLALNSALCRASCHYQCQAN